MMSKKRDPRLNLNLRPKRSRAFSIAVAIGLTVLSIGVGNTNVPAQASADIRHDVSNDARASDEWTFSTATHPAGSASVNGGASGGGVYRYGTIYYQPTVGHMAQPLGKDQYETAPSGDGMIGKVSHTTYGRTGTPDIGLLATGTKPIEPIMRVSDFWTDAPIVDVAHPGEIQPGLTLCHSGWASTTQAVGGYRCGQVPWSCAEASSTCSLYNAAGLGLWGDSGGPVWAYADGGVKLYGWVRGAGTIDGEMGSDGSYPYSNFVPVWVLQNYNWPASEVLTNGGYPAGNDGTGCFVTTRGCLRS